MPLTPTETDHIVNKISPILAAVTAEYSFEKYPADEYGVFKTEFSALTASPENIKRALEWKWGHWGKPNYPQHHRELIADIQTQWKEFLRSDTKAQAHDTFLWWQGRLGRPTTYITTAFITHLIHHQQALPIIDQHNFRGMNALVASVRPDYRHKKKPSNWHDIVSLKAFMDVLCGRLPHLGFGDLDRFLMMYGRNHVVR